MVYGYLLDLYRVLDKRKKAIELHLSEVSSTPEKFQYQQGRLTAINDFKEFLTTHYHEKMPRRIQNQRR